MFRRPLTLVAVALSAAAALPSAAHATGSFRTFRDRAAYLAAVQASNGVSRPQIVNGANAAGDETSGTVDGVTYSTSSPGATFTALPEGGVFVLNAGADEPGRFYFNASPPGNDFQGAFGFGFSFVAGTAGTFIGSAGPFGSDFGSETYTFAAGEQGFFAYLFDPEQNRLVQTATLEVQTSGSATITGIDVADERSELATVPEPATVALTGVGLAAVGLAARRRVARA